MSTTGHRQSHPTRAGIAPVTHGVVVYSDIGCPWAHVVVHRLHRERFRLGLDREVTVDHRSFPLELVNNQPTPKELLDVELPVCENLEPEAGWNLDPPPWTYPVSTLPAMEAVQAAKRQGAVPCEALDLALRRAMFEDWRCLAVFAEVLDVADAVESVDAAALWDEIRSGRARADVFHHFDQASTDRVPGSPTLVLPDGSTHHNPGIEFRWTDGPGSELVIERDEPEAIVELVERAAALRRSD